MGMDGMSFLAGKRFLITQPMIRSFCGSTMVTLELAKYLSSVGARVTVYTNIAFSPALDFFETAGVRVISSRNEYNWSLQDYDYIWIHSLTFPQQILEELKLPFRKTPAFIFLHMSPLDSIPDEHPWIYDLENSLSSLSLYISDKTLESNKKFGLPPSTGYFRNPAPVEFKKIAKRKRNEVIYRVLVVSNHPPKEVEDAKKILADNGVCVDIYGEGQDNYEPVSPEVLKEYDAVITIGKTVQYCIVGSLPVYVYDHFGGPGWLSEFNYELAKENNFSGRPFSKKTEGEIVSEILNGYTSALNFCLDFLAKKNDEFIIDRVLEKLLKKLKTRKVKPLAGEYVESVKAAVGCAEIRFIASEELGNVYKYCDDLKKQLDECENRVKLLDDYEKRIQHLEGYKKRFDEISGSKRVKLLNKILAPHDRLKDFLKK